MKSFLDNRPRNRSVGQALLKLRPVPSVIERVIEPVTSACEQQAMAVGILRNDADVRKRMFWQAAADALPSLPEVGGLVDVRAAVIHKMEIYGDVGSSRIKTRRLDAGDGSPGRQAGDVPGDVLPFAASLRGEPHLAVISARPNQALLNLGRRDREDDLTVERAQVVANQSSGGEVMVRILSGKVGADDGPALTSV